MKILWNYIQKTLRKVKYEGMKSMSILRKTQGVKDIICKQDLKKSLNHDKYAKH